MKRYLAVYTGTAEGLARPPWSTLSEEEKEARRGEGQQAWQAWAEEHAAKILDAGSPLGPTKRVGTDGISDAKNSLVAYTIVEAESHEAAAALFQGHPHFALFPGDAVEIMECLSLPGR